jgi:hypothetical protein
MTYNYYEFITMVKKSKGGPPAVPERIRIEIIPLAQSRQLEKRKYEIVK